MRICLALKGLITEDEIGTFMGSLVTTKSYNIIFSNCYLHEFFYYEFISQLEGFNFWSDMQQHSNTYISYRGESILYIIVYTLCCRWKKWVKEAFKIVGKSVFWIFLGGLIPMLAGGFIKRYWISLVVTIALVLAMQCGKNSYKIFHVASRDNCPSWHTLNCRSYWNSTCY